MVVVQGPALGGEASSDAQDTEIRGVLRPGLPLQPAVVSVPELLEGRGKIGGQRTIHDDPARHALDGFARDRVTFPQGNGNLKTFAIRPQFVFR